MACRNPPALTDTEEAKEGCYLTTGTDDGGRSCDANSFGSNGMSSPFMSPGYTHSPHHDKRVGCCSYPHEFEDENNRFCGYLDQNCLTDSKTDPALINVKNDMMKFHRESEILYPDVGARGLFHAMDGINTVPSHCLMNRAVSSLDYGKSVAQMNFKPPRYETTAGYPIKAHGVEAKSSIFGRPQMTGNFSSSECSTSVLPLIENFGVTANKNDFNVVPRPFISAQIDDRNFLTLGIGSGTEIRSNCNFSTEEMDTKLEDAVSSRRNNSLGGQSPKSPLSLTQLKGKAARIQTNGGGTSRTASNLADRMSTRGGLVADSKLNSIPFYGLRTPQANAQPNFPAKSYSSVFDPTPSSLCFGRPLISQPDYVTPTLLASEITRPTYFASQSVSREHDYGRHRYMNVPSEPFRNCLPDRQRGSSISHAQLGKLFPVPEGRGTQSSAGFSLPVGVQQTGNLTFREEGSRRESATSGSLPSSAQSVGHSGTSRNMGSVEAPGNNLFSERIGFQMLRGSSLQSAAAGPFPKRLGVQPNDFAKARTTTGCPPLHLAGQVRPLVSSGQQQYGVPAQPYNGFPGVDTGRVMPPPSRFLTYPSLKRRATESPTSRVGQRRKIFPQHNNSAPLQRQSVPAAPAPIPAAVHIPPAPIHIKWQVFDGSLEPIGQRCLLCKRELSFTAEGQVHQPAIPPAVAVLPCGHTFHDHCLQIITPEDQSKNPPCIPCAIGET